MKCLMVLALLAPALALDGGQDGGSGALVGAFQDHGEGGDAAPGDNAHLTRRAPSFTQLRGIQCCQDFYDQVPKTPGNACINVVPYYGYIGWFKGPGSACARQCVAKYGTNYAYGVLADGTSECDCSYGDPRLRMDKC